MTRRALASGLLGHPAAGLAGLSPDEDDAGLAVAGTAVFPVVIEAGNNWVANIGLGTLREQLQHVAAV
ncbi:MAG TPA: hypothetical protein VHZ03_45190 [Trebonia sp.]|jgi:hypothetical protein|nr:hypothetical protein [Trebonia sp.]